MLAFSPLASAPLGADAARLPEVIAQGASGLALGGSAAARPQIGVQSADIAAGLSLGGNARAKPAVSGRGAAGLGLAFARAASARGASSARLETRLSLAVDGGIEAQIEGLATAALDLSAAARSAATVHGRANRRLDFQRVSEVVSQIDVSAVRSLPLVGSASAWLAGAATTAGLVPVGITGRVRAGVVPQSLGDIDIGGAAQVAAVSAVTAVGKMALVGQGAVASRTSAGVVAALAIAGDARAGIRTLGQAETLVPVASFGVSAVMARGNGALPFATARHCETTAGLIAAVGGGVSLPGRAGLGASVAARAQPAQLDLAGGAAGTILEPREADGSGSLPLSGEGHVVGTLTAMGDGAVAMPGSSATTVTVRAASAGRLGLARAVEAELLVAGGAGRAISLAGTARAALQASVLAQGPRLAFEGEAAARSDGVASGGSDLAVGVASAASGAVTAGSQLGLDALLQVSAGVSAEATLASVLDLRGAADCSIEQTVQAEGVLLWHSLTMGHVVGDGSAEDGHDLAGGSEGATATHGAAHITFAFARAFAGDVDVVGDSARLIGFGGAARARAGSTGETSDSVVGLSGGAAAGGTAQAEFAAGVALVGGAQISVAAAATSSALIRWTTAASATAPRSAQSQGSLFPVGASSAQSAVMGTATGTDFAIGAILAGSTQLAAGLRSDLLLEGATVGMLDATARAAGQFDVARSSAADVEIGADAGRGMPLIGAAGGAAHVIAARSISAARLEIMTEARSLTKADAASGSVFMAQGHVTGQASLHGTSQGHVSVTRLGRGDVLVVGAAARGMVFLGAADARAVTQAAANLPLEPEFAGAGTTLIRVALQEQEVITGRGAAWSTVKAVANASGWELGATAISYRAPPALGRSEPPRLGLSGRLVPTNAGRILRG